MNTEQKAEAYDKAIEKAQKELRACGSTNCDAAKQIFRLFPELCESEDERIMEKIIATIHLYYGEPLEDEAKEMIAWLEKQGEHANFRNKIQIGDKVTRNKDGVLVNLSQLNRIARKDEKQGEQKPVIIIPKFRVGDEVITENEESLTITRIDKEGYRSNDLFICDFDSECVWDLVEKKPAAWSKEDDIMVNDILRCLPVKSRPEYNQRRADWIKSLKNRVQPKYEWSEEDEKMFNSALWHIKNSCSNGGKNSGEFEVYNWVKSVKDRVQPQNNIVTDKELAQAKKDAYNETLDKIEYHDDWPTFDDGWNAAIWYLKKRNGIPLNRWKPSDDQMHYLRRAINYYPFEPDYLEELYEDLKKLKGE